MATSLIQLALIVRELGQLDEARRHAEEAIEVARAVGARPRPLRPDDVRRRLALPALWSDELLKLPT